MQTLAPIALFVYRRTRRLNEVLDALEACPEFAHSDVYVFSDGPRDEPSARDVAAVRELVRSRLRANMRLIESPGSKGLDPSILEGVSRLLEEHGRVIVLEDDLLVAPNLLTWFNAALDRYEEAPEVMQISGHMMNAPSLRSLQEGVFLPFITSWGWATWKRAWDQFDPEAKGWDQLAADKALRRRFDLGGAFPFARMLEQHMQAEERLRAWDIRWYWTVFRCGGLALFPPETLVLNVGTDSLASHNLLKRRLLNLVRPKRRLGVRTPALPARLEVRPEVLGPVRRAFLFRGF